MYNEQNQLTRAGAEQVIRNGGSVLLKDKAGKPFAPVTKVEELPDEAWFANSHRITRGDAEKAINATGSFTYKGETYNTIEDLPAASEFDKDHKANIDAAKANVTKRRDALNQQIADLDEQVTYGAGNHPLSYFSDKSDEEITKLKGIGPGTLKQIRDAQAAQKK